MLSSFASFLPSALHLNPQPELPRPAINPDTDDEDEPEVNAQPQSVAPEQQTGKGGKEKDKTANETFIFVRPPPSKSNHPLNLQVQLVPPNVKPPSGVVTGSTSDGYATTPTSATSTRSSSDGASLARTSSGRSEASTSNYYSASTASFSSVASSTTSSTARRTIIPLYNLQAHNVLTNVIVDAGTDAKIAKFQKRGIELIDLAVLEPVEVWGEKDKEKDARRESMRISVDEVGAMNKGGVVSARIGASFLQPNGGSRPATPSATSSAASLHSSSHANLRSMTRSPETYPQGAGQYTNHPDIRADEGTPTPTSIPNPPKRNIFNKLFKKNTSSPTSQGVPESAPGNPFGAFSLHPAPVANKIFARGKDNEKSSARGTPPPPLPLLNPPTSPLSSTSQQSTPTQPQTPHAHDYAYPVSPTPTVAPAKEKSHARNASLTAITAPFKTGLSLRNNKNRLSAVVHGSLGGSPAGSDTESIGQQGKEEKRVFKRDVSPNPSVARSSRSQLSLTKASADPNAGPPPQGNGNGNGHDYPVYPLMLTQSQAREELTSLKQQQLQLRPPILGIQPTFVSSSPQNASGSGITSPFVAALSSRVEDPESLLQGQRALMYVWLVRRWLKRHPSIHSGAFGESGFFGGRTKQLQPPSMSNGGHSQENSSSGMAYGGVEVRFEWKRAKGKDSKGSKGAKRSRRGRRSTGTANDGVESEDGSVRNKDRARDRTREREERASRARSDEKKSKRMSTGSYSTLTVSEEGGEAASAGRRSEAAGDDGEDSDPEDSETPWVCTLKIRKSINTVNSSSSMPKVMRVKVGTLSPTPHHPKVVAMLKVPFPLPDVEVERMGVIRRKGFPIPSGSRNDTVPHMPPPEEDEEDEEEPYNGLVLTAEEIKDMVCSTGLWLVVREGFGGVGKVSRKGDGWRLRA